MKWYLKVLKQYANFSGRARRKEYWMFALFNILFAIIAAMIDNVAGITIDESPYGIFYFLYTFGVLIPGLAVGVRRLHDIGKKWTWILIGLIPFIGPIWLLVLLVNDGVVGPNQYGADPKEVN